jgi:hypothetical protein
MHVILILLLLRAENFMWGNHDLDETILRLQAFEKAGADVLYAPGIHDLSMINTVCRSVKKPVNVVMGLPGNVYSVEELSQAGVRRISVGASMARFAYGAFIEAARRSVVGAPFLIQNMPSVFQSLKPFSDNHSITALFIRRGNILQFNDQIFHRFYSIFHSGLFIFRQGISCIIRIRLFRDSRYCTSDDVFGR